MESETKKLCKTFLPPNIRYEVLYILSENYSYTEKEIHKLLKDWFVPKGCEGTEFLKCHINMRYIL